MKALADLSLFLPYLESGQLILTPGKRLARQITTAGCLSARVGSRVHLRCKPGMLGWSNNGDAVEAGHLPI